MKNNHSPTSNIFFAWHHLKCEIPFDWEPTAYSMEPRNGRVEFSTRKGVEAVFSWELCRNTPSRETLMAAFLRANVPGIDNREDFRADKLETGEAGAYLFGRYADELPCQAMHHLPEDRILLRWIFSRGNRRELKNCYIPLLQSCESNNQQEKHYAIFGHNFIIPKEFEIEDMMAMPANVMMAFERKDKLRLVFRRWGMTDMLLESESPEHFYERILKAVGCRPQTVKRAVIFGMDGAEAFFNQRGQYQMDNFMGRVWKNGKGKMWFNREEKRLYAFEQIGPPKAEHIDYTKIFSHLKA